MPRNILMPSLSAGMEQGNLSLWLKKEGDKVSKGEVIAEIETDKATMEMEAEHDGVLLTILVEKGTQGVAVGTPIGLLLAEGETAASTRESIRVTAPVISVPPLTPAAASAPPAIPRLAKVFASPLARHIAAEHGIDVRNLSGSGPHGRIVRLDVERARDECPSHSITSGHEMAPPAAPPFAPGSYVEIPHSNARRVIARRLLQSKVTIPHFYLSVDCEIDRLLALRTELNAQPGAKYKLSVNDLVIKAAAIALRTVPAANASWTDDAVLLLNDVDISIAVATDGGLITPIVRRADQKGLATISMEVKDLAKRAREGKLKPEEYQGGGFSISNLGMYGIKEFAAIINPPQSCILAVGAGERRAIVRGDDIVPATVMTSTLSVDHRSVDGAVGAEYLAAFKVVIEQPLRVLL